MGHGVSNFKGHPHCCDSQREFLKPEATSTSPVIWIIRVLAWRIGMTQSRHGCHVQQMELPRSHNLGSRSAFGWLLVTLSTSFRNNFPYIPLYRHRIRTILPPVPSWRRQGKRPEFNFGQLVSGATEIVKPVPWELWISLGWWWLIVSCW